MNNYFVYKHTAPNGKIYIGITKENPLKRWNNGFGYLGNQHFWFDIVQFGWRNIKHEIIKSGLSKQDAEAVEIELIRLLQSNNPKFGYNISSGGSIGGKHSEASRLRMSLARMGAKNHNAKAVRCIETNEIFGSAGEASRSKNINQSHISAVCLGKRKTAGNLHWEYH